VAVHNVLVGSAFLTGFALAWGANDFQLGLLGAIPFLGSLFQVVGAYVADRWPDHRRLTVALIGLLSRGTWFAIAAVPFFCGDSSARVMTWLLALYFFYQATQNASGPGWVAWMAVLVPERLRGRYLGRRNLAMEAFSVVTVLAAGAALDAFREGGYERQGFALLQVCAGLAGVAGFLLLRRQPDPGHSSSPPEWNVRYLVRPLHDVRFRRLVVFNLLWLVGMTVCTPFLNAHLLKNMHWDFKSLAVLGLLSSLAAIVTNPVWGRLADRHGYKPVLTLCSFGLLLLPLFYVLCPWGVRWPIYVSNLLTGVFLSGFTLALFSLTLEGLPAEARAMGSAVMAGVAGPAVFLSGAASGWVADVLSAVHWQFGGLEVANYQLLFVASILMRLPALFLLKRIHQAGSGQSAEVSRQEPE
jgi:MFS family permease